MTEDNPIPPHTQPRGPNSAVRKFVFTLGMLAIFWVVFVQVAPNLLFNKEMFSSPPATDANVAPEPAQPSQVTARLDAIETRLTAIEETVASLQKPAANNVTLEQQVAMLQSKIDAVAAAPPLAGAQKMEGIGEKMDDMDAALQDLDARLEAIQHQGGTRLAAQTAFSQMKEAMLRGDAFTEPLKRLVELSPQNPKLQDLSAQLTPMAETGVSSQASLKETLAATIPKALSANDSGSLTGNLRSLIRIRKTGEQQSGSDDESILARAEARLAHHDLSGCIKEMTGLSPKAAAVLAPWLATAQAHLDARSLADAIEIALAEQPDIEPIKPVAAPAPRPKPAPPVAAPPADPIEEEVPIPSDKTL